MDQRRSRPGPRGRLGTLPRAPIERGPVEGVRTIALVHANSLAHFMFLLPALEALRRAYPGARIALLAKTWHARFLEGRECGLDEVVIIPDMPGFGGDVIQAADSDIRDFFAQMRERRFDLAFQLHDGGSSNSFTRRLRARITIGARMPGAAPLDRRLAYAPLQNERLRLLELAGLAGARAGSLDPHLPLLPRDAEELSMHWRSDGRPLVVLHPGADDIRTRWPAEGFARVADELAAKGAQVAIHGTQDERGTTRAVLQAMRSPAADLTGALTLSGLAALLARASLVISNDTGALHLAQALGTPTVGIFGLASLIASAPLAWEGKGMAVALDPACPICGQPNLVERCAHEVSFVAGVSSEKVIGLALELFTPRAQRTSAKAGARAGGSATRVPSGSPAAGRSPALSRPIHARKAATGLLPAATRNCARLRCSKDERERPRSCKMARSGDVPAHERNR